MDVPGHLSLGRRILVPESDLDCVIIRMSARRHVETVGGDAVRVRKWVTTLRPALNPVIGGQWLGTRFGLLWGRICPFWRLWG